MATDSDQQVTDYARNRLTIIDLAVDKGWEITPVAEGQVEMIRDRGKVEANYEWTFLEALYRQAKRFLRKV